MARPGLDSPFDETQMKVGRRLAMKVLNASKFVLVQRRRDAGRRRPRSASRSTARCSPGSPRRSSRATDAFEAYDYTTALEVTEKFFWEFCDDYLELVKERAYGARGDDAAASAKAALAMALHVQLRLLAPFLPYVTEEVWSWWQEGSIHRQSWPTAAELGPAAAADPAMLAAVAGDAGRHPRREVAAPRCPCAPSCPAPRSPVPPPPWRWPSGPSADLKAAGKIIGDLTFTPTDATEITVDAEIAPQPA